MYAGRFVESAPTGTFFRNMGHRYSGALLRSTPQVGAAPHTRLHSIAGRPPDMVNPPAGCRFAPRCEHAVGDCSMPPDYRAIADAHLLACHNPNAAAERTKEGTAQ
ncbi:MAG: oligopeptide/dipeptide ABC transporter ATP-binding protein [Rhodococcus sp. (in: high G+C Gram-positive bacteria)]